MRPEALSRVFSEQAFGSAWTDSGFQHDKAPFFQVAANVFCSRFDIIIDRLFGQRIGRRRNCNNDDVIDSSIIDVF